MSSRTIIRGLTPSDAESYAALRAEMIVAEPFAFLGTPGDDHAGDPDHVRRQLANPDHAIFAAAPADDPSRLLAVSGVFREPRKKMRHRAHIWGVYVTDAARGLGLGRAVVSSCIAHARKWPGVEIVSLSVSERGLAAQSLYASLGFVAWGVQPDMFRVDGVPDDEIHMQLRL